MEDTPAGRVAVTLNFSCVGAMITLTSGTLLKGLIADAGEGARQRRTGCAPLNDELR
jgi:hypothetical protein